MLYWHALLALSAFGLTAPHPTCVDLTKTSTHFPLHEGMWTPTSPSHQPKASNLCPESADCGLRAEFHHSLEVGSLWDLLWAFFCFEKNISAWWGEGWGGKWHLTSGTQNRMENPYHVMWKELSCAHTNRQPNIDEHVLSFFLPFFFSVLCTFLWSSLPEKQMFLSRFMTAQSHPALASLRAD